MHGSSTEYIVQIRVQDYWIDLGEGLLSREFRYREDAEKHLAESKKNKPDRDFQLIKRMHSFIDEVV
jgi:hypothetical protein